MGQKYYSTQKRKGKHLCLFERQEIEKALDASASISSIARMLNRNKSSISREIKRDIVVQRKKKSYVPIKKDKLDNWTPYTQI
ncbi:MAG: helix-turn-helix domain-containing protein [Firmicutes bacterium]|nr:helix-turn-helix domain-containing protein [Bacillota bacterium]MCL1953735.1 helix-turn-helix domain-containing protein [Bacillota bacterium]